ncbi:hypothetical protein G7045_10360 [Acidovorax sp. HDW3]|uniref:hypothetical protein n=1 Tax=Acidovorax sp. HDW3 TaxID=2714923 RepID=UPI00140860FF|nr:hypothetical protein [Acidovorax sp. HDW3]QIL44633.1 hypothetical protein G7045_10360 [Acidovorax sp. HDW3]
MHTPNEVIDLAEKHSQEVARFSLAGLEEARKRANALLVLLLAGGGALGGLGLARVDAYLPLAAAAMAGAVHWFALAAYVAWNASTTAQIRSWATPELAEHGYGKWLAYAKAANAEAAARGTTDNGINVLQELRLEAVRNCEQAAQEYRAASGAAYAVVDRAYRLAACMPISAAAAAALVLVLGGR